MHRNIQLFHYIIILTHVLQVTLNGIHYVDSDT